jgi:hypothetical protein
MASVPVDLPFYWTTTWPCFALASDCGHRSWPTRSRNSCAAILPCRLRTAQRWRKSTKSVAFVRKRGGQSYACSARQIVILRPIGTDRLNGTRSDVRSPFITELAQLACIEGEAAIAALLRRLPKLQIDDVDDPDWRQTFVSRGLNKLPAGWEGPIRPPPQGSARRPAGAGRGFSKIAHYVAGWTHLPQALAHGRRTRQPQTGGDPCS